MSKRRILHPLILWTALAIGALLGLIAGSGNVQQSIEQQAIQEYEMRKS